jgi:L-lactate dehydrogenase complex protein LldG
LGERFSTRLLFFLFCIKLKLNHIDKTFIGYPTIMSSRDRILAKIAQNQPEFSALPGLEGLGNVYESPVQQFKTILEGIGGKVIEFSDWSEIKSFVKEHFDSKARITSTLPELAELPN